MASMATTARPAQTRAIVTVRGETLNSASRLRRDFRELLAYDLCRLDDRDALLDAFIDRPSLEPAVRVRPEVLRPHVPQAFADPLRGDVDRLRLVRVHVDDPDRELLCEGVAIEQVEPAVTVVRHQIGRASCRERV